MILDLTNNNNYNIETIYNEYKPTFFLKLNVLKDQSAININKINKINKENKENKIIKENKENKINEVNKVNKINKENEINEINEENDVIEVNITKITYLLNTYIQYRIHHNNNFSILYNCTKTNDAYIESINASDKYSGTTLVKICLEINNKLNIQKTFIYDAATIRCNEITYGLSKFKLLEKERTFYMGLGFDYYIKPYINITYKDFDSVKAKKLFLKKIIEEIKTIKISDVEIVFNNLIDILYNIIINQDYTNLDIKQYFFYEILENIDDENIIDMNILLSTNSFKHLMNNFYINIDVYYFLKNYKKYIKNNNLYDYIIKIFNDKTLCKKYKYIDNYYNSNIFEIKYNNYNINNKFFKNLLYIKFFNMDYYVYYHNNINQNGGKKDKLNINKKDKKSPKKDKLNEKNIKSPKKDKIINFNKLEKYDLKYLLKLKKFKIKINNNILIFEIIQINIKYNINLIDNKNYNIEIIIENGIIIIKNIKLFINENIEILLTPIIEMCKKIGFKELILYDNIIFINDVKYNLYNFIINNKYNLYNNFYYDNKLINNYIKTEINKIKKITIKNIENKYTKILSYVLKCIKNGHFNKLIINKNNYINNKFYENDTSMFFIDYINDLFKIIKNNPKNKIYFYELFENYDINRQCKIIKLLSSEYYYIIYYNNKCVFSDKTFFSFKNLNNIVYNKYYKELN